MMKLLLQTAFLCLSTYALDTMFYTSESKVWNNDCSSCSRLAGLLPGDVNINDPQEMPGFVASPPKELHGGSVYAAWQ
eukprot:6174282-Pleurochrysis_carterae.AAC.1